MKKVSFPQKKRILSAVVTEGSKTSGISFDFLDSTIESLGDSISDRMEEVVQ